ncbi:hypothetical protein SH2C18_48840 [Clostridium sediminicola]|uniref:type I-B CRISPR-associated protein Cas5b n=1 Tax=Clostridium sediminicola TaxID=3114879 RepID=UPI0031F1CC52
MDVMKFTLEGSFGFFKKPDVNTYLYFTYGNIHKVALLGIFGAILGYKGYNQMSFEKKYHKQFKDLLQKNNGDFPEFYEKLKHLKIGIKPNEVSFDKKVQVFNNSVGYASKEQGGNLIVKEQWLENPSWQIYIAIEDDEAKKLADALKERSFVYIPYLGKNDHLAGIKNVELIKGVKEVNSVSIINSLFNKEDFNIANTDGYDVFDEIEDEVPIFKYEEKLPISLEKTTNKYELGNFLYTNATLIKSGEISVYDVSGENIVFI